MRDRTASEEYRWQRIGTVDCGFLRRSVARNSTARIPKRRLSAAALQMASPSRKWLRRVVNGFAEGQMACEPHSVNQTDTIAELSNTFFRNAMWLHP
ncbi:MAG: hypothetical protein KGQ60_01730 [Planctomycetes bacterium]|nr:hypothetical protein [Planctomycetota bacterium]